jgi:hypothetical protein
LLPAIAAACLAAVAAGLAIAGVFSGGTQHERSASSPIRGAIDVNGGRIAVPSGWVATARSGTQWCLTVPGSSLPACAIGAYELAVPTARSALDVDRPEPGRPGSARFCTPPAEPVSTRGDVRTFGGRAAQYREWEFHCPDGAAYQVAQFTVITKPAFVLYTRAAASATVREAMADIARRSSLPSQSAPLPFMQRGVVRSVLRAGPVVTLALDLVVRISTASGSTTEPLGSAGTVAVDVPTARFDGAGVAVGAVVYVETDGTRVLIFRRDH